MKFGVVERSVFPRQISRWAVNCVAPIRGEKPRAGLTPNWAWCCSPANGLFRQRQYEPRPLQNNEWARASRRGFFLAQGSSYSCAMVLHVVVVVVVVVVYLHDNSVQNSRKKHQTCQAKQDPQEKLLKKLINWGPYLQPHNRRSKLCTTMKKHIV